MRLPGDRKSEVCRKIWTSSMVFFIEESCWLQSKCQSSSLSHPFVQKDGSLSLLLAPTPAYWNPIILPKAIFQSISHEAYLVPQRLRTCSLWSIWPFQTPWGLTQFKFWIGHESFLLDSPRAPQEGVGATKSQHQGDKHLCLWKIWVTLLSNSGGLSRLRPRAEAAEGFSGRESTRKQRWMWWLQQPHLSQRSGGGISSHHLQPHMARRPISTAELCVRTSSFSGGPHSLEAPNFCLGSQLLCKKWLNLAVSCCGF